MIRMNFKINEDVFKKYIRILKLARTPTREEFSKISIVAAVGIAIIGAIGFIIYELITVVPI